MNDAHNYYQELQNFDTEQGKIKLRTLALEFHSTLARIPKLKQDIEVMLRQDTGIDYDELVPRLEQPLAKATTLLLEIDMLPNDLRNSSEMQNFIDVLETTLTVRTVDGLIVRFHELINNIRLRIERLALDRKQLIAQQREAEKRLITEQIDIKKRLIAQQEEEEKNRQETEFAKKKQEQISKAKQEITAPTLILDTGRNRASLQYRLSEAITDDNKIVIVKEPQEVHNINNLLKEKIYRGYGITHQGEAEGHINIGSLFGNLGESYCYAVFLYNERVFICHFTIPYPVEHYSDLCIAMITKYPRCVRNFHPVTVCMSYAAYLQNGMAFLDAQQQDRILQIGFFEKRKILKEIDKALQNIKFMGGVTTVLKQSYIKDISSYSKQNQIPTIIL